MTEPLAREESDANDGRNSLLLDVLATRLLYVEDDDDLRDMIARAFVDAGFDVSAVSSAEAALQLLESSHFDIVVTDYNLTGATGAWLLERAASKGRLEQTAVIVLTSERSPRGVPGYKVLRKPIDFGVLLAKMSEAIGLMLPTAPIAALGAPRAAELDLVLYVTSTSQESHKALRNLRRALKPYDPSRYRVTVVDVANGGDDAWYDGLEEDRIIVTPTLVRKRPGPKTWIVGTLSPTDSVEQMLAAALGDHDRA